MRHRGSLRRRLTGLCAATTIAALVVTGVDSWQRERTAIAEDLDDRLQTLAHMVALNTRTGVEFDGVDDVRTFLQTVVTSARTQAVAVYTHDGRRFAVAGRAESLPTHRSIAIDAGADVIAEAPLPYRDDAAVERRGTVLVRASGEPLRARLAAYLRGLLWTDLIALATLGCASWWLVNRLLRPIAALVETTHEVRRTEDYSLRAAAATDDEIGALVSAFNSMIEAIQARDTHLAGYAERLQEEVRERTAQLRSALEAAESSTRAKSTFVANMSHEIRTPLNAILGMAELALEAEDPRELHEYLGVIRSAGSNLLGVLCGILDLSKIESDKLELSIVDADLETLVMDALRPLTAQMHSKDLDMACAIDASLAEGYRVDDVRVRQVLTNLVGNAIKFTERGFVRVAVQLAGTQDGRDKVRFVVEDSGIGIPADRLQAVFEPFTQADSTITRRFAGTGLGLHITKRLVTLMGGSVHVASEPGRGTTFTVDVPFERCASPVPPPVTIPPATRLVLLGRSPSQRHAVGTIAQRLGIRCEFVDDATALRDSVAPTPDDVVLLDERDPDGDAALAALVPHRTRVLLLTNYPDIALATTRCRDHGFGGYLAKPLSRRELAARIANIGNGTGGATTPFDRSPAAPTAAGARPLRVLVAEDNAVNQKLIHRVLTRDGHTVTIADNGRACCEAWGAAPFDLVLMDMQMPEMSGLQATVEIRRRELATGHRTPIVALTANTTGEDRRACLDAGMDEVLSKPISIPKLRAVLARLPGGGPATRSPTEVQP